MRKIMDVMVDRPLRFTLAAILGLAGAACSSHSAGAPARVPVSVAQVERRAVPDEIDAIGTVEPMRLVRVTSQVSGVLLRVHFHEGDEVAAGQVLFEVDPRPYQATLLQAEANLARDQAQAENAARDAERYAALAENASVSREDYQQKRSTADALAAAVRADSAAVVVARLNLDYATIRAPINGRTGSLLVHEGNQVQAGTAAPLVTINELRPILVRFAVPAIRLPALRRHQSGGDPLRVLARTSQEATADVAGTLSFMDNHVDSATGTVLLKGQFPNRDGGLWPGELVNVTLVLDIQADAVVIPAQAVLTGQQGTYVFVVDSNGAAHQRPVTVARTLDSLAVIASGITPGTTVVTDGQLRLTPDAKVEIRTGSKSDQAQQ